MEPRSVERQSNEMTEALRRACAEVRTLLARAAVDEVHTRYRIGRILLAIKRAPGSYGTNAVAVLARQVGKDEATLYRYASVPKRWPPSEMRKLAARRTAKGEPLSWSHWVALALVQPRSRCDRLVERSLRQALTIRELVRMIESARLEDDPKVDDRAKASLESLTRKAERLSAAVSGDIHDIVDIDKLERVPPREVDAVLGRAIAAHRGLCERAQSRLDELVAVRERLVSTPKPPAARREEGSRPANFLLSGARPRGPEEAEPADRLRARN